MSGWNLGDVIEAAARARSLATAQIQGERRFTWAELERRSNGVASALVEEGLCRQDKVAQYLYNCPEYLESVVACFKSSLVPVNTNYRYKERELIYLWDNADVVAVVFHGCFGERIEGIRPRLPGIRLWLWVDDGSGPCPDWARSYETVAAAGPSELNHVPWPRHGDDLLLLYTGGTTGIPKGVMWRQEDLFLLNNRRRVPAPYDLARGLGGIGPQLITEGEGRIVLPACPQMHGTGLLTGILGLVNGGAVVTLAARKFDPTAILDAIQTHRVQGTAVVGDAFCRPILQALDAEPQRWDLSSLVGITSSGAMWSEEVKRGLLRHHPSMVLRDALGSSESLGMASSESGAEGPAATASFELGPDACVLTDDGRRVEAGSGELGRIAVSGHLPVGYYKDPEKTAHTFPVVDGVRYSIAGDYATVQADGTITFLGRGSVCINTGGEKVFPEEVEEVLKLHPQIRDAACVGVPDSRFGEALTALVETDELSLDEEEVIRHVKRELADYKAPRRVIVVSSLGRSPSGKLDYQGLRKRASARSVSDSQSSR